MGCTSSTPNINVNSHDKNDTLPVPGKIDTIQYELNGFFLDQNPKVAVSKYGLPVNEGETLHTTWKRYRVADHSFMTFEALKTNPKAIHSIQLTGVFNEHFYPFLGIRIGDDKSRIYNWIGKPDNEFDTKNKNTKQLVYKDKNFSFEINNKQKLIGIKIWATQNKYDKYQNPLGLENTHYWRSFEGGIIDRKSEYLIFRIRPDIKIYIDNEMHIFNLPLRDLLFDEDSFYYKLFFSMEGCLYTNLLHNNSQLTYRDHNGTQEIIVHKFSENNCLEKIIFSSYYGRWRAHEIHFKF